MITLKFLLRYLVVLLLVLIFITSTFNKQELQDDYCEINQELELVFKALQKFLTTIKRKPLKAKDKIIVVKEGHLYYLLREEIRHCMCFEDDLNYSYYYLDLLDLEALKTGNYCDTNFLTYDKLRLIVSMLVVGQFVFKKSFDGNGYYLCWHWFDLGSHLSLREGRLKDDTIIPIYKINDSQLKQIFVFIMYSVLDSLHHRSRLEIVDSTKNKEILCVDINFGDDGDNRYFFITQVPCLDLLRTKESQNEILGYLDLFPFYSNEVLIRFNNYDFIKYLPLSYTEELYDLYYGALINKELGISQKVIYFDSLPFLHSIDTYSSCWYYNISENELFPIYVTKSQKMRSKRR